METPAFTAAATRAPRKPQVADLLRILFTTAERRIGSTTAPKMDQLDLTKAHLTTWRAYQQAKKDVERLQGRLAKMGLSYWGKRPQVSSEIQSRRRAKWEGKQVDRKAALRDLRFKVGLDLLGMSNADAQQYLRKLKRQLERI